MRELHRTKLLSLFEDNQDGIIYLKGAEVRYRHNTDFEFHFRQESNFWYLTGVNEPDFHMMLDLNDESFHLFAPQRDSQYAVWHGFIKSAETYRNQYEPDHLHYDDDLIDVLQERDPEIIYCLNEQQAEFLEHHYEDSSFDTEALSEAITYCRSLKTDWELDQLREACRVNNEAHREVMKRIEPGMFEYEVKALFDYHNRKHGLLQEAYNGIHATGKNSAILHYVNCDSQILKDDLFLIDAGYEYNGYSSDFTRTFPADGSFSELQAGIYESVLDAQKQVLERIEPGVKMEDLHLLSARAVLEGLKRMDLVYGEIDELMDKDLFALFYPHGLGHFIGLDTHDVGGYPKGVDRIDRPGLKHLRVRRTLEPNMVLTIEPGCYIIPALLDPAFEDEDQSRHLNEQKLREMYDFGGVRIEDNIIVTENGHENMTDIPKEIKEVEELMSA